MGPAAQCPSPPAPLCPDGGRDATMYSLIDVLKGGYIPHGPRAVLSALAAYVADRLSIALCSPPCSGDCCGVYLYCEPPRHCREAVAFAAGVDARKLRGLERVALASIEDVLYVVYRVREPRIRAYFRITDSGIVDVPPPCPTRLLSLMHELGGTSMPLRTATEIIAHELGVKMRDAREVLSSLAKRLCVLVENGYVMLLD